MNSESKTNRSDSARHDAETTERCLLYLLGEMNAEQSASFEAQLAASGELRTELIAQSETLVGLSTIESPVTVACDSPANSWRLLMTIASIAACLMVAFLSWPKKQDRSFVSPADTSPESLLIAKAWAEGSLASTPISEVAMSSSGDVVLSTPDGLPTVVDEDTELSWLVSAMEAGAISDG